MSRRNTPEVFLSRIDASGGEIACWPYMGRRNSSGYGLYNVDGKTIMAHRYAYTLVKGTPKGIVCHHCDFPPCCNPRHLYDGSHEMNMRDQVARGRRQRKSGEDRHTAKIPDATADEIADLYATGKYTQLELAHRYGVNRSQISRIANGKRMKKDGTRTGEKNIADTFYALVNTQEKKQEVPFSKVLRMRRVKLERLKEVRRMLKK